MNQRIKTKQNKNKVKTKQNKTKPKQNNTKTKQDKTKTVFSSEKHTSCEMEKGPKKGQKRLEVTRSTRSRNYNSVLIRMIMPFINS